MSGHFQVRSNLSRLGKAMTPMLAGLNRDGRTTKDKLSYIAWAVEQGLKNIADKNITRYDTEDQRLSRSTAILDLFKYMPKLYDEGAYEDAGLSKKTIDTLQTISDRILGDGNRQGLADKYALEHNGSLKGFYSSFELQSSEIASLYGDIDRLLLPFEDRNSRASVLVFGDADRGLNDAAYQAFKEGVLDMADIRGQKHPESGYVSEGTFTQTPFGIFGTDPRHIQSVQNRTTMMDYSALSDEVKERVFANPLIETNSSLARRKEASKIIAGSNTTEAASEIARSLRVQQVSIDTSTWNRLLQQRFELMAKDINHNEDFYPEFRRILAPLFSYLNESGSIIDPALQEAMQRNIVQRYKIQDNLVSLNEIQQLLG